MARASWAMCALAVGFCFCVGCASLESYGLTFWGTSGNGDHLVAGSVNSVSHSVEATLSNLGLYAKVNRDGETVTIASRTPRGSNFKLVLARQTGKDGAEQTRIRVQWEHDKDEDAVEQILAQLGGHS